MLANQEKLSTQIYEAPSIIYDGVISTRAGSPIGGSGGDGADGVDPADLFD
jgi:hypothetical protein